MYASAAEIRRSVAESLRPPERITVSEGIARTLVTATGPYDPGLTPYMAEPANMLDSRRYRTVVFIGPARTGKTVTLIDGWIARNVRYAPGDMLVVQASQDLARDYSKRRIKRAIEASPELRARLSPRRQDDNTYDKVFANGMVLALGWPSGAQLSGRDFRYVAVTEYDASSDDIDGEGSLYALASKRTETFMSAGKTLVETSVRRVYTDAKWRAPPEWPHMAPPASGATMLYNIGTRCWYYWRCLSCGEWIALHPDIHQMFDLPPLVELAEQLEGADPAQWAGDMAVLACKHCGTQVQERHKRQLNNDGIWVPDGCTVSGDREIEGEPRQTDVASFALSSVAAAYGSWRKMLEKYATAILEYRRTGDDTEIKSTVNLDQGRAYLPLSVSRGERGPAELQARAERWEKGLVPAGVRFLTAAVDIQAGRFVVQVEGWGVGLERWYVDRYSLRSSVRPDESGEVLPLNPAAYLEDWDVLIDKVITRRYELADGSRRTMPVLFVTIDSGGEDGVTQNAYAFWRSLRARGLHHRVRLVKGTDVDPSKPLIRTVYPDTTKRKDRNSGSQGDVPLVLLNATLLKDGLAANLSRPDHGPGYVHFPDWLPGSWFAELTAETRGVKRWECPHGVRNEAWDLSVYNRVATILMKADRIDWNNPPGWAEDWPKNTELLAGNDPDGAAPPIPRPAPRRKLRRVASSYMSR